MMEINLGYLPYITTFGFVSYKEPWTHFMRTAKEYYMYIIVDGNLYIDENGIKYPLKKGDIIILEPNHTHFGYKSACCDYYYIHFQHLFIKRNKNKSPEEVIKDVLYMSSKSLQSNPKYYFEYKNSLCYLPKYFSIKEPGFFSHFSFQMKEALQDYNRRYLHYRVVFSCKLLQLFIELSEEHLSATYTSLHKSFSNAHLKAQEIQKYINSNYSKKITRKLIQQEFKYNYDYINRVFKKITDQTIIEYLNNLRLEKARELIINTSMSFSEISSAIGISSLYYFSTFFKNNTGFSPSEYRKQRQKNDF